MSNENLIKAIKKQKGGIIFAGVLAISTILVGVSLFDKNNTLGKTGFIAGTIGFALFACINLVFINGVVKDVSSELKDLNSELNDNCRTLG